MAHATSSSSSSVDAAEPVNFVYNLGKFKNAPCCAETIYTKNPTYSDWAMRMVPGSISGDLLKLRTYIEHRRNGGPPQMVLADQMTSAEEARSTSPVNASGHPVNFYFRIGKYKETHVCAEWMYQYDTGYCDWTRSLDAAACSPELKRLRDYCLARDAGAPAQQILVNFASGAETTPRGKGQSMVNTGPPVVATPPPAPYQPQPVHDSAAQLRNATIHVRGPSQYLPRRGTADSSPDLCLPTDLMIPAQTQIIADLQVHVLLPTGSLGLLTMRSSVYQFEHDILRLYLV